MWDQLANEMSFVFTAVVVIMVFAVAAGVVVRYFNR